MIATVTIEWWVRPTVTYIACDEIAVDVNKTCRKYLKYASYDNANQFFHDIIHNNFFSAYKSPGFITNHSILENYRESILPASV